MKSDLSEEKTLVWNAKDKKTEIRSLKELLDVLVGIKQEEIDEEINTNVIKDSRLLAWLESNFSNQTELIAHLRTESKEYTPQQLRERIIRDLNKST